MASDQEKFEREERAKRLRAARERAGMSGPKAVVTASDGAINENVYKAHEQGRNGFTVSDGRTYAELFGVSLAWLYLGVGSPNLATPEAVKPITTESEILAFLARIDGLSDMDITVARTVIMNALNAKKGGSARAATGDRSQTASLHREVEPSR